MTLHSRLTNFTAPFNLQTGVTQKNKREQFGGQIIAIYQIRSELFSSQRVESLEMLIVLNFIHTYGIKIRLQECSYYN